MQRIQLRERTGDEAASSEAPADGARRGRIREALVCPYCRDAVERRGTVVCGRRGCGALYHRECWEECATQYGGCAVYGCASRKCREVTLAGWFLRLARLLVAALLFPPRVVQAVKKHEHAPLRTIYQAARHYSDRIDPRRARGFDAVVCFVLYSALLVPIIHVFGRGVMTVGPMLSGVPTVITVLFTLISCALTVFCLVFAPVPAALLLALGFHGVRLVARAFASEVGALERADAGGGTVLGRLRLGLGKKA